MNGMASLLRMRMWETRNRLVALAGESRLKIVVVTAFAAVFWWALYRLFFGGFRFLTQVPGLPTDNLLNWLMERLLLIFFFSLTMMLAFSNGIIAYGSLYRSRETAFLLGHPLKYVHIFLYEFFESVFFSSWAFLFLSTPLLVAYGQTLHLTWEFYVLGVGFFSVFIFVPAGIGTFGAIMVATFFPRRRRAVVILGAAVMGGAGLYFLGDLLRLKGVATPFSNLWMKGILEKLAFCENPLLPSYWVARGIVSIGGGERERETALRFFLTIVANGLFLGWLCAVAADRWLLRGWTQSQSGATRRFYPESGWLDRLLLPAFRVFGGRLRFVILKDLKTFVRDPVQWSQFLIFFGLLFVYFLNLKTLHYDEKSSFWRSLISFLNLTATCLTLSTFTSRFVFPQLSLEGRRFWVLGMIPMDRRAILWGKFIFSFTGALAVSELLIFISNRMLALEWELTLYHGLTVAAICLGLSGLSVGLGAMYPNFREDNPSKIVAGFGGTLNLVLSLAFVSAVVALEVYPYHQANGLQNWSPTQYAERIGWFIAAITGLTVLTTVLPMALGFRRLDRMDL